MVFVRSREPAGRSRPCTGSDKQTDEKKFQIIFPLYEILSIQIDSSRPYLGQLFSSRPYLGQLFSSRPYLGQLFNIAVLQHPLHYHVAMAKKTDENNHLAGIVHVSQARGKFRQNGMSLLPSLTVKVFVNVLLVEVEVEAIGAPFVSTVGCPFLGFGMSIPVNSIHMETGIVLILLVTVPICVFYPLECSTHNFILTCRLNGVGTN